jgi:hypothetical protein
MPRAFVLSLFAGVVASAATTQSPVTFYKDVLPVLQRHCQGCHRPGEVAPMSFLDYQSTRPWAKAMKAAVLERKMPPWLADPHYGKFANDRRLTDADVKALVKWSDAGAPQGDPKDAPPPVKWLDGWNIGKPDLEFEMPNAFDVQASGTIEYQYVVIPTGFAEDRWVQMAEVRPGNRAVVHHVIAFLRPPGSKWMADAKPGVPFVPARETRRRSNTGTNGNADPQANRQENQDNAASSELLVGYAPGLQPWICLPGAAKLVKAGSDIVLQLHYTANGTAATDKTKIGIIFAKGAPERRQLTMSAANAKFVIPPGDPAYEVHSQIEMRDDSELVGLMPHMHLRGKDFLYKVVYPTGESSTLLSVPQYDFNWQLFYFLDQPLVMPKGTRIECTAHFDNSPNNPANPDPSKEVRWGDQSWEEMMIGWFDVTIPAHADPANLYRSKRSDD